MVYLTNRFYVALRLFRNISQMMSKCVKNKEVAHEPQANIYRALFFSVSVMFLSNLMASVIYWTDPRQHGIYLFYTMNRKEKTDKLALYHLTVQWFVPVSPFLKSYTLLFLFLLLLFFFVLCSVSPKHFSMPEGVGGITLGIFGWGYAAGTQEPLAYTRASLAEATLY